MAWTTGELMRPAACLPCCVEEALDRMFLPPLTESTSDWYVDCAEAATVITDNVADCIFYTANATISEISVSTVSGVAVSRSSGTPFYGWNGYSSINAEMGETLSVSWSGLPQGSIDIYDDTGSYIETVGPGGGSPVDSSALPYTGRYIIFIATGTAEGDPPVTSASITVTSSGAMVVNTVQALYDIGGAEPGRLDCGDACP